VKLPKDLERFRGPFLLGVGVLACLAAQITPWFRVPMRAVGGSGVPLQHVEAAATVFFEIPVLAVAVLSPLTWLLGSQGRELCALCVAAICALLMAFPNAVMIGEPELAANASWVQQQTERLTWLGGDISTSQGNRDRLFKDREVVVSARSSLRLVPIPNWAPHYLQLGRLPEIAEWLGYSNRFSAFVARGWFLALGGCGLIICACLVGCGVGWILAIRRLALVVALVMTGLVVVLLSEPVKLGTQLKLASDHVARGNPSAALIVLESAASDSPVIREDTGFMAQVGLLSSKVGRTEVPSARLWTAFQWERQGLRMQALETYRALLREHGQRRSVRREASRGLVRMGIQRINSTGYVSAADLLEEALEAFPSDIKANLALQLVYLRTGNRQRLIELVELAYETLANYSLSNKKVVLSVCQENLCYAALADGDLSAAVQHRKGIRKP
jgi:tetratricopeptide (TPR) repeat protein